MGLGKQAMSSAVSIETKTKRPTWQIGQQRGSCSPVFVSQLLGELAMGSVADGRAGIKERHSANFSARLRLARKPKWRIRTKPEGSTWRRNRRMNSTASSVIVLLWFPSA